MRSGTDITADHIEPQGLYRVYGGNGVRGWTDTFTHEGVYPLVGRQGARCGNVHLARGRFWASEHAVVASPARDVDPAWLAYLLEVMNLGQYSQAAAQPGLAVERICVLPTVLPEHDEQVLVVRYLDHLELRVGRAINAKRELVTLLDERKRVVSQGLVTRGLHEPTTKRASGIEWLGEVPARWETRPAKRFYREVNERSTTGEEQLLSVSHITGVTPRATKNVTMFMAESYVGHKLCRPGDLVVNTMWAWMGAIGVASETGIISPSYGVYRPLDDSPLQPAYANLLLRTRPYIDEYTCRSTGIRASRLRLYPDRFLPVPIVCPPAGEQADIVGRVMEATGDLDAAVDAALREVELLQEYRTRLVEDVVTGRCDVRAAAAALPEIDPSELEAVLSAASPDNDGEEDDV
jgi:type I restriction enzyme S subunit